MHSKCLVEAGLFLSHQVCDAKELNNTPKTQDSGGGVWYCRWHGLRQSRFPRSHHTSVSFFGDSTIHFAGEGDTGSKRRLLQTISEIPLLKECWANTSPGYAPCLVASPPSFSGCTAHVPGTALDLISIASHLPITISGFMISEPGRSVALLSASFYWAVQGRIEEPDTMYSYLEKQSFFWLLASSALDLRNRFTGLFWVLMLLNICFYFVISIILVTTRMHFWSRVGI